MAKSMTKYLRFDKKTVNHIMERDRACFFCLRRYHMERAEEFDTCILDIMHVVPKSHLGLGVEENGVLGCRYHHSLYDNGNKGLHDEMKSMLYTYMQSIYQGWTPESVTYSKWKTLSKAEV